MIGKYLGPNQRRILKILEEHGQLSAIEIASLVFEKPVEYKTKEYFSTHRSLQLLKKKHLLVSTPRRKMWKIRQPINP